MDNFDSFNPTDYDKNFLFKKLDKELLMSVIDNG